MRSLTAFVVASCISTASIAAAPATPDLIEVFSADLSLPGVLQQPTWVFVSRQAPVFLVTTAGLAAPNEVAWWLWKVDATGKLLSRATVTAETPGEAVPLGCVLDRTGAALCVGNAGHKELVTVRVPFDGPSSVVARSPLPGLMVAKLDHSVELSDGSFLGLGGWSLQPFAIALNDQGALRWALLFLNRCLVDSSLQSGSGVACLTLDGQKGRLDEVLEDASRNLLVSGVLWDESQPKGIPLLGRIDSEGRVLAEQRFEDLVGKALVPLESPAAAAAQGAPAATGTVPEALRTSRSVELDSMSGLLSEPRSRVGSKWAVVFRLSKDLTQELVVIDEHGAEVASRTVPCMGCAFGAILAPVGEDRFVLLVNDGSTRTLRLMMFQVPS